MKTSSALILLGVVATVLVLASLGLWILLESDQASADDIKADLTTRIEGPPESEVPRPASEYQRTSVRRAIRPRGIIDMSIDRYRLRMGEYPAALDDLHRRPDHLSADQEWDGPYINNPRLLHDPWNQPYQYRAPGVQNEATYDLWSSGADKISDTEDDIGNWSP